MGADTAGAAQVNAPSLRSVALDDAAACHRLSQAVGWPHRVEDWETIIALGRGVVATLDGEIVATALWWDYGAHAALGMIIVSPSLQGQGIGGRLMDGLFSQAAGRSLLLNATAAGTPLYRRVGFVPCGGVTQYQGHVTSAQPPELAPGDKLRPVGPEDASALVELDTQATGLSRPAVVEKILSLGEGVILERAGRPIGYSVKRDFGRGVLIGPVVAPSSADAWTLVAHWLPGLEGHYVRLDVVDGSDLADALSPFGLKRAGQVVTMVRGEAPSPHGPARLHALSQQALG